MATILGQTRAPFKSAAYQYIRTTDKLPSTDEADAQMDPLCRVKLFGPGRATWYIAGFDPETSRAFGVVTIQDTEIGDFFVDELVALRCKPFGLPIERDLHWTPTLASELLR